MGVWGGKNGTAKRQVMMLSGTRTSSLYHTGYLLSKDQQQLMQAMLVRKLQPRKMPLCKMT